MKGNKTDLLYYLFQSILCCHLVAPKAGENITKIGNEETKLSLITKVR